jgi:methylmalonyl-CoA/ethylmalonyl-CoA epimerase
MSASPPASSDSSHPIAALDHIGIAVSQLPELKRLFGLLGLGVDHEEDVPEQGVKTHFLPLPREAANLEFLEVTDPSGTVAKFIEKRGPGIHHLAFRVPQGQLDSLCARLKEAGVRLIFPEPKPGAHHMRVNFIHPQSAGGMLVEVMEPAAERKG